MPNAIGIFRIYPESFRVNLYTIEPFRMIGLIDVSVVYTYGIERVTLPFFRSSGTNSGKIMGLWYPIAGIKIHTGDFTEFTKYINHVLTKTSRRGMATEGWLAKSLFFGHQDKKTYKVRGFSTGRHYKSLLWIGKTLRNLFEAGKFKEDNLLDAISLNSLVTAKEVYINNTHTQKDNFENFIEDIYKER